LLWMFLACCFPLQDSDLFWHLKTGEWILEHRAIPGYDLYTYTDFDKRWIDLHWGFQVVAASLYRLGGADLLVLAKATILTVALGIACYAGGPKLSPGLRVLCWILPAITISGRGYERPEVVTVLCLAIWLTIVTRLKSHPRWIWALPVLQVVWINCHALFILGLVVGACFVADEITRRAWFRGQRGESCDEELDPSLVIRAGGLCAGAAFVNPYFEEGALFPFVLLRKFTVEQDFYSPRIGEFQQPVNFLWNHGFTSLYLNVEILLWLVAALSFVLPARRGRVSVFRALLFCAFSYLAWKASRNTNIFSVVAGFVLAENLDDGVTRPANSKPARYSWLRFLQPGLGILLAVMILAVISGEWNRHTEKNRPFRLGEAHAWYAHDAARFLGRPGFPERVYASHFGLAAVYTYHNGPQRKVFMDGRLEVCTRETFGFYDEIKRRMIFGDPVWPRMLQDQDGHYAAVLLDSRYSRLMIEGAYHTPGWRLVYADPAAAVFLDERVADSLSLPAVTFEPLRNPPAM
jgi:hypothetical protein